MTIGDRIKKIRETKGVGQTELANATGISKQNIYKYENNIITNIPSNKIEAIAMFLEVSPADLMGWDFPNPFLASNILPLPKTRRVPLLGDIACGDPILAVENMDGEVDIPDDVKADFALRCRGDSMINARILDGDIVYIRQQDTVENNEIAAVLIDDEATLKRVHLYDDHIILEPANPLYQPIIYWGNDMNRVRVLGKAVAVFSWVRG